MGTAHWSCTLAAFPWERETRELILRQWLLNLESAALQLASWFGRKQVRDTSSPQRWESYRDWEDREKTEASWSHTLKKGDEAGSLERCREGESHSENELHLKKETDVNGFEKITFKSWVFNSSKEILIERNESYSQVKFITDKVQRELLKQMLVLHKDIQYYLRRILYHLLKLKTPNIYACIN